MSHEDLVRKRWFSAFVLLYAFLWPSLLIVACLASYDGNWSSMGSILFFFAFASIDAFITYHCAYRKKGTILLTLWIIGMPMVMIRHIVDTFFVDYSVDAMLMMCPILILMLSIELYFWINCLRLRKVNSLEGTKRDADRYAQVLALEKSRNIEAIST